ncbi:unnamed protein product [Heligmosomoides polygyrus]|uniref:ELMO domain-containing protein n=1 Tax=Heligmosomoides polygyrus TaxID=6339 RepID=A0A183FYN4_HELPZ|nr:unnamed protein product [Heligmosomoides polygyrus]
MVDIVTTINKKGLTARIYQFLLDLVDDALDIVITLLTRKKRLERALTAVYNFRAAEMEMIEKCTLKHKGLRLRKNFSIENTEEILQKESVRAVGLKRIYLQTRLSDALASLAAYDALVEQVEAIRAEEYVVGNPVHEAKLLKLWHLLKPDDKISSCSGKHWTTIGFQSDEPSRDFRGMGILSLDQLIYLAKKEPKLMRSIMTLANHPRIGFPLAITVRKHCCGSSTSSSVSEEEGVCAYREVFWRVVVPELDWGLRLSFIGDAHPPSKDDEVWRGVRLKRFDTIAIILRCNGVAIGIGPE